MWCCPLQGGPFFGGTSIDDTDAAVAPKLYHCMVALKHFKVCACLQYALGWSRDVGYVDVDVWQACSEGWPRMPTVHTHKPASPSCRGAWQIHMRWVAHTYLVAQCVAIVPASVARAVSVSAAPHAYISHHTAPSSPPLYPPGLVSAC